MKTPTEAGEKTLYICRVCGKKFHYALAAGSCEYRHSSFEKDKTRIKKGDIVTLDHEQNPELYRVMRLDIDDNRKTIFLHLAKCNYLDTGDNGEGFTDVVREEGRPLWRTTHFAFYHDVCFVIPEETYLRLEERVQRLRSVLDDEEAEVGKLQKRLWLSNDMKLNMDIRLSLRSEQ